MSTSVAVVKYNAGNIRSVVCALARLGVDAVVTDDAKVLRSAARVVFPGVGEASSAMRYLHHSHLDEILVTLEQPFLGICLGMQLMGSFSEENHTGCLGIFKAPVVRFPQITGIKVPHMGWNTIKNTGSPLFEGIKEPAWFYFVHSYYVPLCTETAATCSYGNIEFSAALSQENFTGVQFHPEKSGKPGTLVLESFLARGAL